MQHLSRSEYNSKSKFPIKRILGTKTSTPNNAEFPTNAQTEKREFFIVLEVVFEAFEVCF